ncbi:branched-chain amino acid ABC transporter permease [Nocardioides perillae]|uniref:Branched-chain amino acid transport system permease protein n=1 Tax=Nocardioides perillae TaxID=1119534 RepID=A0A7Y9RWA5_9ACTN|nr:branched-chain amino acid ABC transporter permease [Nocardioides perillae]NYG56566.1 branched-chain amino acid transport system permease protein [Nocardioides perillae]
MSTLAPRTDGTGAHAADGPTAAPAGPAGPSSGRGRSLRGRPGFYRSYEQELALFNTRPKRVAVGAVVLVALVLPFVLEDALLRTLAVAFVFAIGALGLNIVTGLAGQVSLGHAFFLGVGAYTAAAISGDPEGRTIGFGITEMVVWLPAAGLVAALFGVLVAPLATRLRGLYLAIVTLGLVFIGEHVFREWSDLTGGAGVGREAATPVVAGYDLSQGGEAFSRDQQLFFLMFALLLVFALAARNIARSRLGRAFSAVRDRDMAAEMMGIDLPRTKLLAFAISSFYAGCAGALLYSVSGFFDPASFNLLLSVQFIAMVLIGGAGTVGGTIAGALFISLLPTLTRELPEYIPLISRQVTETPNVFQVEQILYGLLIVAFLLFEPRGLFGIWVRIRTYWKSWPFSY